MKPRGLSVRLYAAHRGCSPAAVSRALREGRIARNGDGLIDPVAADAAWERNTMTQARTDSHNVHGRPDPALVESLRRARAACAAIQARSLEMEFRRQNAMLIPAEDVESAAAEYASRARAMISEIPDRLGALLSPEARAALEAEVARVCDELSDGRTA